MFPGSEPKDRPFLSEFATLQLLRQDGSRVPASKAFEGKKYVLVYFSAHWCPPCQRFTPLLADFYNDHADRLGLEVLFVSADRQENRMMDFFQNRSSNYVVRRQAPELASSLPSAPSPVADPVTKSSGGGGGGASCTDVTVSAISTAKSAGGIGAGSSIRQRRGANRTPVASGMGNWLALPFKEKKVNEFLGRRFGVTAIPKLVVVATETSRVITKEGKAMVLRDENAEEFPWRFAEGPARKSNTPPLWQVIFIVALLCFVGYYFYFRTIPAHSQHLRN